VTPDEYCRALEDYLTRKNDGHLIRIVGPAFEQVRGWAERGVPLKVAFRGIDRYVERYYAKGPRRRPVRIEFCEADVLDVFEEWRRAVGVHGLRDGTGEAAGAEPPARRRESLARHVERAVARLTLLRGSAEPAGAPRLPDAALDAIVAALDRLREPADRARGDARAEVLSTLTALDAQLLAAAREAAGAGAIAALRREAETDLAGYRDRLPGTEWARVVDAAADRALRERLRLPVLRVE
jgi:hypothetical protein